MKLYEDLPEAMINNNNFSSRFIFKPKNQSSLASYTK